MVLSGIKPGSSLSSAYNAIYWATKVVKFTKLFRDVVETRVLFGISSARMMPKRSDKRKLTLTQIEKDW